MSKQSTAITASIPRMAVVATFVVPMASFVSYGATAFSPKILPLTKTKTLPLTSRRIHDRSARVAVTTATGSRATASRSSSLWATRSDLDYQTKKKGKVTRKGDEPNGDSTSNNILDDLWNMASASSSLGTLDQGRSNSYDDNKNRNAAALDEQGEEDSSKWILAGGTCLVVAAAWALAVVMGNDLGVQINWGQLFQNPSETLETVLNSLEQTPPLKGMLYFSSFYILAEILAIPAVPILTASSGYLFGTSSGTATCLFSAAIAASISFSIGRTVLRGYVERVLEDNPKFASLDRAIEKEGFKLMLLLRLSPLFPFALSNYLYGASSIGFWPYFFGTVVGFAPGTFAYVYAGRVGRALTLDGASSEPWYVYLGGMAVVLALLKVAGDVAGGVIDAMDEEEEEEEEEEEGFS